MLIKFLLIVSLLFVFNLRQTFEVKYPSNVSHFLNIDAKKVERDYAVSFSTSQKGFVAKTKRQINKGSEKWNATRTNYFAVDYG